MFVLTADTAWLRNVAGPYTTCVGCDCISCPHGEFDPPYGFGCDDAGTTVNDWSVWFALTTWPPRHASSSESRPEIGRLDQVGQRLADQNHDRVAAEVPREVRGRAVARRRA